MTSPVHFSEVRHLSHSPPNHVRRSEVLSVSVGQLAKDFYTQSKASNEFFEALTAENRRIISLLEQLDQRVNDLSVRVLKIEDMILQPFRSSSSRK